MCPIDDEGTAISALCSRKYLAQVASSVPRSSTTLSCFFLQDTCKQTGPSPIFASILCPSDPSSPHQPAMLQTGYNAARAPSVEVFNEELKALKDTKPDEYALMNIDVGFWSDDTKPKERLVIGGVASSNAAERSVHFTEEEVR